MDGFIGFARCGRIPPRISVSVAPWNGFDAARIICFTAFRCNKRLIKRPILASSTASNFALAEGHPKSWRRRVGTVIERPPATRVPQLCWLTIRRASRHLERLVGKLVLENEF